MDRNGLVGGLEHEFYDFPYIYILGIATPTDFHIFRGLKPPTSGDLAKAPWIFDVCKFHMLMIC
jgi:hypothetical protein